MSTAQHKAPDWIALILLIGIGTLLRSHSAVSSQFWEDEAESSINAQTILLHGIPTDRFLGEPIYENICARTWPDSEEYEFKDLSYSDKGVAVYHGWLPLYTIAGSMKAFGLKPDVQQDTFKPVHGRDTLFKRTFVPRLPAILFAIVFMVLMYLLGRELAGPAGGWAALIYTAVAKKNVYYGSQARYYSLTLLFIAGCGWTLWRIIRQGRWRDYLIGSAMWVLLFHTHLASCVGMCVVALITLPWHHRAGRIWAKRLTAFGLVAVGTLPWVWWTGYLQNAEGIPSAWRMDGFWPTIIGYALQRPVELGLFCLGILAALFSWCFKDRMPKRMVDAFGDRWGAFAFVSAWACVMYLTYAFCMPAASFFLTRLSLMIAVPCILFASMIVGCTAVVVNRRWAFLIAPMIVLVLLAGTKRLFYSYHFQPKPEAFDSIASVIDYLNETDLADDTRLYCTPNYHLVLTYYTGLPIQSVGPVRKRYLDTYPGPIVLFQKSYFARPPKIQDVIASARGAGIELDVAEAHDWALRIQTRQYREEVAPKVAEVRPALDPIPDYLKPLYDKQVDDLNEVRGVLSWNMASSLMFHGLTIRTSPQWWQAFQYAFVDRESRSGDNVNYAHRISTSTAFMLPKGRCTVYHCPPPATPGQTD